MIIVESKLRKLRTKRDRDTWCSANGVSEPVASTSIGRPHAAAAFARAQIGTSPVEVLIAIGLNARHEPVACWTVSQGSLMSSLCHPREVFGTAERLNALARGTFAKAIELGTIAAVILAHNHPSGDPEPSPEDTAVTKRCFEAGRILGLPLLDHIVVTINKHTSIRESHYHAFE